MKSLFVRLSIAFALTAGVACLTIGLIVYQQTASGLFDRARDTAAREARSARDEGTIAGTLPRGAQYGPNYPLRLGAVYFVTSWVPQRLLAGMSLKPARVDTIITGSGADERVWAAASGPYTGIVYVSDSLANQERELTSLRSTLILASLVATAVAALIGVALAAWLSSRLRRAAATARRIAAGELDERVRLNGRDEVAALARAIDEMADALEERILRERQFAANAAHELRTPLAGVVAASELLPEGRPTTIVREGIGQLRRLVDQLLELARLEGGLDAVRVDQVDLQTVARSAQALYPAVTVDAPASSIVATDLRRLERIIANLIENSLRYGEPPVTIHVDGHSLAISDHGPGFQPEFLARATDRFSVGDLARTQGAGLGLAIAAEHARMLRARLAITNRADGGGIVTVELADLEPTNGNGVA